MTEIFKGTFFAVYNQIGLYDTEDCNSYPAWETGLELVVFGKKAISVSAKGDSDIAVKIYTETVKTSDLIFLWKWPDIDWEERNNSRKRDRSKYKSYKLG
jgi:hypothetical protein